MRAGNTLTALRFLIKQERSEVVSLRQSSVEESRLQKIETGHLMHDSQRKSCAKRGTGEAK